MKKYFTLISAAALLLVGCAKEVPAVTDGDEAVTFSVALNEATKASADNDGMGANVDNIKVAVYMHTGVDAEPYKFYDAPVAVYDAATKTGTFTVNLIKSQTYQIVVWADKDGRYTCDEGLQEIVRDTDHVCNNDEYDAFFASVPFTQGVTTSTTITAKRPFAQLNFITTDIKAGFEPSTVSVTYTAPSQFNALTDKVSDSAVFTHVADVYKKDPTAAQNTIIMDYLFATAEDGVVLGEVATKVELVATIEASYFNIPVKRNYRTNIIGALLTDPTDFQVVVDANWDGETNVDPYAAADVAMVQNMLNAGAKEIHLENAPEEDVVLEISKVYAPTNVLHITFPATDKKVTFQYKATGTQSYPALSFEGNVSGDLVVNMPQSTVTLAGAFGNIEATTAANTLIITEGSTFNALNVKGGNVVLYGMANYTNTTRVSSSVITVNLKDATDLRAFAARVNGGDNMSKTNVVLASDIDLNNEAWTSIGNVSSYPGICFLGDFDGAGHTIKNLNCTDATENHASAGLFGGAMNTIKNVNVDGATIYSNHYAGVIAAYTSANCTVIENCHVKNVTVTSEPEDLGTEYDNGDKVGGIVGYMTGGCKVINCSIDGFEVKAYRDLGGIIGMANGNVEVKNCSAKNGSVIQDNTYAYKSDVITTVGEIIGRDGGAVTSGNTYENVNLSMYHPDGIFKLAGVWCITSKEGFLKIAEKYALDVWHSKFKLFTDIDLQGVAWTPLNGGSSADYTTTLDGNGHTISNLTVSGTDNVGFFSNFAGTIKNLTISGANVSGNKRVGILAGQASCFFMENVNIVNSTVSSTGYRVGALVGHCYTEGSFKNCVVDNANISGTKYVGGITGTAGSGEAAATKFEGMTVKNTTISCSDEAQKVDGTYGAFIGSYWVEPIVSGTNVAEGNTIFSANSGFGQHE